MWRQFFSLLVIIYSYVIEIQSNIVIPKGPLFEVTDPGILIVTDSNFTQIVKNDSRPILIDFYHPYCPHCQKFAPIFKKLALYYLKHNVTRLGVISCMHNVQCRREQLDGYPSLISFNFNPKKLGRNELIDGDHTYEEVLDFVQHQITSGLQNATLLEKNISITKTSPIISTSAPEEKVEEVKELTEDSILPTNSTLRLRDAATAFIFGIKQSIFFKTTILDDDELDALKVWIHTVAKTFPGIFNRYLLMNLYQRLENLPFLSMEMWTPIVIDWQKYTIEEYQKLQFSHMSNFPMLEEWQRIPDLFQGEGIQYQACASYTCGQWNLFHMMTMYHPTTSMTLTSDPRTKEELIHIRIVIRRFMKHFFTCLPCRQHYLSVNTMETIQQAYENKNQTNIADTLRLWLWDFHNLVNQRLSHPQWPKLTECKNCHQFVQNNATLSTSSKMTKVHLLPTDQDAWDSTAIHTFLLTTYRYIEKPYNLQHLSIETKQHFEPYLLLLGGKNLVIKKIENNGNLMRTIPTVMPISKKKIQHTIYPVKNEKKNFKGVSTWMTARNERHRSIPYTFFIPLITIIFMGICVYLKEKNLQSKKEKRNTNYKPLEKQTDSPIDDRENDEFNENELEEMNSKEMRKRIDPTSPSSRKRTMSATTEEAQMKEDEKEI